MARPGSGVAQWPLAGQRNVRCTLQYATPTTDSMGGRGEPTWTDFGTWWVRPSILPAVQNETESTLLYMMEGPYRQDLLDYWTSGTGLRLSTHNDLTLKVIQVENPELRNRTLVAHCANAVNTQ